MRQLSDISRPTRVGFGTGGPLSEVNCNFRSVFHFTRDRIVGMRKSSRVFRSMKGHRNRRSRGRVKTEMRGVYYWGDTHHGVMGHNRLHRYRTLGSGVREGCINIFQEGWRGFQGDGSGRRGRDAGLRTSAMDKLSLKGNNLEASNVY